MNPPSGASAVTQVATAFHMIVADAWRRKAKASRVSRHSKTWWTSDCAHARLIVKKVNNKANWIEFHKTTKKAKRAFFDRKLTEIAKHSKRPWNLMNWAGPRRMPPSDALQFEDQPCDTDDKVWNALHSTFNVAKERPFDMDRFWDSCPPPG